MEFDFSSDTPNRPRRGPPARFAERMSKLSGAQESHSSTPKPSENAASTQPNSDGNLIRVYSLQLVSSIPKRRIPRIPCRDGAISYTKENTIDTVRICDGCQ